MHARGKSAFWRTPFLENASGLEKALSASQIEACLAVQVDMARRYLNSFWKEVRKLYRAGKLTADGGDFFSPRKRWLRQGNEYRALVEPLDIANWYKLERHLTASGHYFGRESN